MSPKELQELLIEIKSEIPEINSTWLVVDDSQLGNTLENKSLSDNAYLIGVMPNYGTLAKNQDNYKETITSQLLILEKTDYSELTQDEFIAVFERTYQIMRKVKLLLISKMEERCYSQLYNLDVDALDAFPVWKKSQCNGWSLDLEFN